MGRARLRLVYLRHGLEQQHLVGLFIVKCDVCLLVLGTNKNMSTDMAKRWDSAAYTGSLGDPVAFWAAPPLVLSRGEVVMKGEN